MKSILIVTELFTIGGLETHVRGEITRLSESGVEVHLATGEAFQPDLLPTGLASIAHDLQLGPACTPEGLLTTVNKLRNIICEHSIDRIHIHPFTSIIPAVMAAELEGIPYAITLHGPASMASYGPIYDFLLKNIILPNAGMIIAVSPEVKKLLAAYTAADSVSYIPNAVSFSELANADIPGYTIDPRWLVASRLDEFKINGIIDFCIKAKACGIPGVVIAGDGPAKDRLLKLLDDQGLSGFAELIGMSIEVQPLMQKFFGVGGMGRVVLEGVAERKPVVLIGYDGVKGVVDNPLLLRASEQNFSGRGLPAISLSELAAQLRDKTKETDISAVYDSAKSSFNDRDAWAQFIIQMSSLAGRAPGVLVGLYHSLSGNPIVGLTPYLQCNEVLNRIEDVVCSNNFYDPRLLGAATLCRQRLSGASLNQAIAERDGQIVSLKQVVVERDGQISDLNRIVDERGDQLLHLSEQSKYHYELLTRMMASRSWKITRPIRAVARFIRYGGLTDSDRGKLYNHAKRIYQRFPISYEIKLVFRKYFLKITGWTPATPIVGNSVNAVQAASALTAVSSFTGGAVPQISESVARLGLLLQPQAADNRVPYFGVRRQEGRRRVAILTNQLLDWNDGRPRFGGGERYALELARLLKELMFEVTFYQPSFQAPGEGEYYGFNVVLLRTANSIGEFHYGLCSEFTELTKDFDHVYYHLPEYASGKVREDGLMTCHGIWFDHNNYTGSIFRAPEWFQQLYSAFSSPRCVVSVDTNSIGVIRSLWPELASNMRYIPNFYDATAYFPCPELRNNTRLTILFPRRAQINRGSRIFGEIVSLIPHDVEIIWLGEGDPVDTQIVKDVCKADQRATFAVADFDQMPLWYQRADIAVIPTIACEGTSLSCLEALAAGCAVVSTNVGGLPDLVYDGMNGLLVDPNAQSIAAAINRLIVDTKLRERLQRSASETARHFELRNWRARWVGVLHEYGWVSDRAIGTWQANHGDLGLFETCQSDKWLIVTRNAIHGGVESLIREEAKGLNAPVVVCGGHDRKDTCPFDYTRADNPKSLERIIAAYDVILYHWLPDWCLDVLRSSGKRCIEFVHRIDTAESDKTVPTALVTHSAFLARYIHEATGRSCRVVDHPIAIDRFKPQPQRGKFVGAITSYYDTKGIDIFLQAWAEIKNQFPSYGVRFYGAGDDLPKFRKLARELELDVDFRDAIREPWEAMKDFACFVVPSRIEGLPVAILEALAMNIPVVASDLPGMVEFNQLSEARGYSSFVHLARNENPRDFAAVMSRIFESGIEQNSSAYINDYYSPEKHCADLMAIYKELCH